MFVSGCRREVVFFGREIDFNFQEFAVQIFWMAWSIFPCSIGPVTGIFLLLAFRNQFNKVICSSSLFRFAADICLKVFYNLFLLQQNALKFGFYHTDIVLHSADLPLLSQFWMARKVSVRKFKMHVLKLWDFVGLFFSTAWVNLVFLPPKSWSQMRHFI